MIEKCYSWENANEDHASAFVNSQTTARMKELLKKASKTEAEMFNREEELRQNMEELQATQEELIRKEREFQQGFSLDKVLNLTYCYLDV